MEPTRANEPVPPTEAVPWVGADPTQAVPPAGGPVTQPSYQVPPPAGPPPDRPLGPDEGPPPGGGPPRWLLPALVAAVVLLALIVLAVWLAKRDGGTSTASSTTTSSTTSTTSTSTTTTTAKPTTTTAPATTTAAPTTTAPPTTANPNPTIGTFSRSGGSTVHCTTPADSQTVTLSWTSTGGTEAWVAVGDVADPRSAPYNSDPLAANGSLSNVPFPCSNAQQAYTVGIYNATGRATRTITLTRAIP